MTAKTDQKPTPDPDNDVAQGELVPDVRPSNGVAPVPVNDAALANYLAGAETVQVQDPDSVVRGIVARALEAGTLEELLGRQVPVGLRDLMGQTLNVTDVRWGESSYDEGLPFYAIIDCVVLSTGEKQVATTGASQAMAQLYKMKKEGWLPARVKVDTTPKQTSSGYFPVFLSAPEPAAEPQF